MSLYMIYTYDFRIIKIINSPFQAIFINKERTTKTELQGNMSTITDQVLLKVTELLLIYWFWYFFILHIPTWVDLHTSESLSLYYIVKPLKGMLSVGRAFLLIHKLPRNISQKAESSSAMIAASIAQIFPTN